MLAPRSGSRSARGAGELLCSEGSAGEKPARSWASWEEARGLERGESSGEARNWGQAKGFPLRGTPEDQALLGDGSQGEVIGREQRGRCEVLRQRWVCAGGERGDMGA